MNIAEILKNCPGGTKLYSPICGEVEFECVTTLGNIRCIENSYCKRLFYPNGTYSENGEIMLFPSKEQRDWNKFQIPFKFGDIVAMYNEQYKHTHIAIFDKYIGDKFMKVVCTNIAQSNEIKIFGEDKYWNNLGVRYATEKEKDFFFNLLKEQGYVWTGKELIKAIKPKFKVGDTITNNKLTFRIDAITDEHYVGGLLSKTAYRLSISGQDKWKLKKFDIHSLKPYDRVLVRFENGAWYPTLVSYVNSSSQVYLIDSEETAECVIPFEGNEHLIGSFDDPDSFYITW